MPDERGMLSPPERGRILVGFDGEHATLEGDCPDCGAPSSWDMFPQLFACAALDGDGRLRVARADRLSVMVWCTHCNEHWLVEMAPWQM